MTESTGRISTTALAAAMSRPHGHQLLTVVNGQELVLAVNEVEYPMHRHPGSDELFVVLSGRLTIETVDRPPIDVNEADVAMIPGGTWHRTVPTERTVNLILRRTGTETQFAEDPSSTEMPGGEQ